MGIIDPTVHMLMDITDQDQTHTLLIIIATLDQHTVTVMGITTHITANIHIQTIGANLLFMTLIGITKTPIQIFTPEDKLFYLTFFSHICLSITLSLSIKLKKGKIFFTNKDHETSYSLSITFTLIMKLKESKHFVTNKDHETSYFLK